MKTLLNVGCGFSNKSELKGFDNDDWKEIRLDIDSTVKPDIVGTLTDMSLIETGSVDAIYSAHNIEHVFPYEVPIVLKEFYRVLKDDGMVVLRCPDLQSVCAAVIDDKLISTQSERTIQQANIDEIVKYRREKYFYWSSFANKHNLRPLISSLDDGACPLLFPVYTSGSDESRKWFDWGWDNGVNVYSWPSLPKELIVNGGPAFDRWSKLICFPIEENMNTMNFDGEK